MEENSLVAAREAEILAHLFRWPALDVSKRDHRSLHLRAFEIVGQVRGVGLLWGIEIVRDADSRAEAPALASAVTVEAMERGLIVGGLRPGIREANVLRLAPPLVIGEEDVERAVSILAEALTAVKSPTGVSRCCRRQRAHDPRPT